MKRRDALQAVRKGGPIGHVHGMGHVRPERQRAPVGVRVRSAEESVEIGHLVALAHLSIGCRRSSWGVRSKEPSIFVGIRHLRFRQSGEDAQMMRGAGPDQAQLFQALE